jgi:hypothetical protein
LRRVDGDGRLPSTPKRAENRTNDDSGEMKADAKQESVDDQDKGSLGRRFRF